MNIGVRPSLIRWFATYLQGRLQKCVPLETTNQSVKV
jgi:hypothetical protein